MSLVRVFDSTLLRKGHGNYAYFGGQPQLLTNPPPEAINPDPNRPDAPLFAHFGASRPHPSGHPGMGELVPGSFTRGKHGELAYSDGEFSHHHGHDGVWFHLGEALERAGMDGKHAKVLLQEAIARYNRAHNDKSGQHHLPDVDSMEWRKIKAAPYNASTAPQMRPNRSVDGHFVTAFTNRPNRAEKIGHFIESYSVPYWKELAEVAQAHGLYDILNTEWLTRGHISIDDLHPAGRRLKGRGGDVIGPKGELPDSHITNAPGGVQHNPAFANVQSWEVAHHMPDLMHYKLATQRTAPTATLNSARGHIREALKRSAEDPNIIPDVEVPINTAATSGGTQYSMQPLRSVLRSEEMRENLLSELGKTSALTALFGRLQSGGQARPSSGARIFSHLLDTFGGDPDEEGARTEYDMLMQHALQGEHIPLEPQFMSGQGGHPTKKGATHKNMAKLYVKALLSGAHEDGTSNLRHYRPDPAILQQLGVSHEGIEQEKVDARRQAAEALADMMARAFGHQERRPLPSPEDIPKAGLASRTVGGYPEELIAAVPEHVPFISDLAMAPSAPAPAPRSERPEPAPRSPQVLPSEPVDGGPTSPPRVPPPRAPPRAAPPPAAAPAPVAVRPRGAMPIGELSPQQQAARAAVGGFDPAGLREFMQQTGLGPAIGEGELTPQEQQFQQTFGDPRQRLLTEYMKSQDAALPQADRLMKAMENMQRDAAMTEARVMKHVPPRPINIADEQGVRHIAKNLDLTALDVRAIAYQMGDWERIAKRLEVNSDVVKVVKLSIGGV